MKGELFSQDMVKAFLEGRKCRTSRPVTQKTLDKYYDYDDWCNSVAPRDVPCEREYEYQFFMSRAKYQPGDIMYVRETWYYESHMEDMTAGKPDLPSGAYSHRYIFKADCPDYPVNVGVGQHGWRPSLHMPREAARLFFRVTDVKVQNIADMAEQDAVQDGFKLRPEFSALVQFKHFWNQQYGTESPWMWVYMLEQISKEDAYGTATD